MHPKLNQEDPLEIFEFQKVKELGLEERVLISQGMITTHEACAIADLCVSYESTVIAQAAVSQVKSCFMSEEPLQNPITNILVKHGIIPRITSAAQLLEFIHAPKELLSPEELYLRAKIAQKSP